MMDVIWMLEDSFVVVLMCFRTADDSATVGTVVVSRMKMGEIEDGEVDHITADMHQKVS